MHVQEARRSTSQPIKSLVKTMTRSTKPVSIQCLLSETSYIHLRKDPRSYVANTGIEGAREEDCRRKPRSTDSPPTNIRATLSEHQGNPQARGEGKCLALNSYRFLMLTRIVCLGAQGCMLPQTTDRLVF